jgi:23S rRNA A2030 N6-methylase RlmJ
VNPPYQIAERMRVWLPELHALLDESRAGGCRSIALGA